jgi:peptide/nickel transport system permease protein
MPGYILGRVGHTILTLLVMSALLFAGLNVIGNPIYMLVPPDATPQEIKVAAESLGLNLPIWQQYLHFLYNALHGSVGDSFVFGQPSLQLILERLPATLELAFCSLVLSVVVGVPLGLLSGLWPNSRLSRIVSAGSILGMSLPSFWVALLLIVVFAVKLHWLPASGRGPTSEIFGVGFSLFSRDGLAHMILPVISLSLFNTALILRLVREMTADIRHQDFIKFARLKGLSNPRLIFVHIGRTIAPPVITVIGLELGNLIAFSVVVESIFAWPGIGQLLIESILSLDRPVVVAYLLAAAIMFAAINLVVDIACMSLDPRIAHRKRGAQ